MQESIIIEMPKDLTSFEFYNNVIKQLRGIDKFNSHSVILDFSETIKVEPLVIPNILCMGYILREITGEKAKLYIPDIIYSGKVKNYLNQVGFTHFAEKYELYEFVNSTYGGAEGKQIDPLCGTLYFSANDTNDDISRGITNCIMPFADEYLFRFKKTKITEKGICEVNEIVEFLEEILSNCVSHAKSFSFTTLHAKYSVGKIYIATSDVGCGFGNTMDMTNKSSELEAIIAGVYERKYSKIYGLYNVIRRVLEFGGKVRIHSTDTQVIFTPRILDSFIDEGLWFDETFSMFNIKRNIHFEGVHIEIELPLERRRDAIYN